MRKTEPIHGCEFLDDGSYGKPFIREPWRKTEGLPLSISFLRRFIDSVELAEKQITDADQIAELTTDIALHGIKEPVTIYYDSYGKLSYRDGYHRFIAAEKLGYKYLPCVFRYSVGKIKAKGINFAVLLPELIEGIRFQ